MTTTTAIPTPSFRTDHEIIAGVHRDDDASTGPVKLFVDYERGGRVTIDWLPATYDVYTHSGYERGGYATTIGIQPGASAHDLQRYLESDRAQDLLRRIQDGYTTPPEHGVGASLDRDARDAIGQLREDLRTDEYVEQRVYTAKSLLQWSTDHKDLREQIHQAHDLWAQIHQAQEDRHLDPLIAELRDLALDQGVYLHDAHQVVYKIAASMQDSE